MLGDIMNSSDTQNPSTIPKQIIPTSYLPFPNHPFSPFRTVESSPFLGQATVAKLPRCSNVHVRMEGPSA